MDYTIKLMLSVIISAILICGCIVPGSDDDDSGFKIKNIEVTTISETSVMVNWETTENARCQLYYGINNYHLYAVDSSFAIEHTLTINNLIPSTDYLYKIIAQTPANRFYEVENLRFSTIADTVPPIIENLRMLSSTSSSITLAWETNEITNCVVKYGETSSYTQMKNSERDSSITHYATVSGLNHLTDYHFQIEATDISGNTSISANTIFRTSDLPIIKFVPDTVRASVGDTISVAVSIEVENLAAISLLMDYDNARIRILSIDQGSFFYNNSGNIFQVDYPRLHQVLLIAAWMVNYNGPVPVGTSATGIGNVCNVRFEVLREGSSEIRFIRDDTLPVGNPDGHPDSQLYDMSENYIDANWFGLYIDATND